jgi:hypothetical protein
MQRIQHRAGNGVLDSASGRLLVVAQFDGKGAALAGNHRCVVEQRGHALDVQRRRHHEQPEIVAQRGLDFECERQAEIGVQRPLVKLVEDDGRDAGKLRIVERHAHENALRHHFDPRAAGDAGVEAYPIPDGPADLFAAKLRHAPRRSTRGKPPRLDQDDATVPAPGLIQQMASGTSVVLPAPGGAASTARRVLLSSARR